MADDSAANRPRLLGGPAGCRFAVAAISHWFTVAGATGPVSPACAAIGIWDLMVGTAMAVVGGVAVLVFACSRWAATAGHRWRLVVAPALAAGIVYAVVTLLN